MPTVKDRTSGKVIALPEEKEEAEINKGIAADADTYELTDEEFKQLKKPRRAFANTHTVTDSDDR